MQLSFQSAKARFVQKIFPGACAARELTVLNLHRLWDNPNGEIESDVRGRFAVHVTYAPLTKSDLRNLETLFGQIGFNKRIPNIDNIIVETKTACGVARSLHQLAGDCVGWDNLGVFEQKFRAHFRVSSQDIKPDFFKAYTRGFQTSLARRVIVPLPGRSLA